MAILFYVTRSRVSRDTSRRGANRRPSSVGKEYFYLKAPPFYEIRKLKLKKDGKEENSFGV